MAVEIAKSHHENWDGNGYPGGTLRTRNTPSREDSRVIDTLCIEHERSYKTIYARSVELLKMKPQEIVSG